MDPSLYIILTGPDHYWPSCLDDTEMKIVPLVTGRIGVSPNMAIIWHPGTPDLI